MRILISGAGIAGPSLAWFLARTGAHRITVLEKSHMLLPHGQSVDIHGAAVTAIRKMGLLDDVRKAHTKEKGTKFIDSQGKSFASFPLKEGSSASMTAEFEILRGDLATILYNASKGQPNVKYMFGTTVKNILSNDEKGIKVELSNGNLEEFDLLVAADGQWSKIRKQYFPPECVQSLHKGMYSVYYTVPRLPHDEDWWNVYIALRSRLITLRPDPYGTIRAIFSIMPLTKAQDDTWRAAARSDRITQEALLKREFADAGWEAERLLAEVEDSPDLYFHDISQIRMSQWSNGRIVCLGDTAYAPTPLTGMGTSLAIIGAYVLAGEISKLKDDEHPSRALRAYENTLRPFVEQTQKIPAIFPGVVHPRTAIGRWMLLSFISLASRAVNIPWVLKWVGGDSDAESQNDGFKLPEYALFSE